MVGEKNKAMVAPVVNREVRHFLDLDSLTWDVIWDLLTKSQAYRAEFSKYEAVKQILKRKRIVGAFFENSTRTRVSFEMASKNLGAGFLQFNASASSLAKLESLRNTLLTLQALSASAIVVRHASPGFPYFAARTLNIPIINAGDGAHAHPTQTLADLLTIVDKLGTLRGLKTVCVGDFLHSRVARSFVGTLVKFGSDVTVVAPSTMLPNWQVRKQPLIDPFAKVVWTNDLETALKGANVVMVIRFHKERHQPPTGPGFSSYAREFAIKMEHIENLSKDAVVLHAGPVNEGVDLTSSVMRSNMAKVEDQVNNGVFVRMAVLEYVCLGAQT